MSRKSQLCVGVTARQAGQVMVEFVLTIVFLFVLFVSVLQMILLMHAYNTLADAAKEGVRYAIVHGTQNSICSGPSTSSVCPKPDSSGANVQTVVINFASLSFQNMLPGDVAVNYNPKDQNGTCPNGTKGSCTGSGCSDPGCTVRVTVSHTYTPLFGLPWPSFTLNAAAQGRILN